MPNRSETTAPTCHPVRPPRKAATPRMQRSPGRNRLGLRRERRTPIVGIRGTIPGKGPGQYRSFAWVHQVHQAQVPTRITHHDISEVTIVGFQPTRCRSDQWYGSCPLLGCSLGSNTCFSVQVTLERYYCHRCHCHGHQVGLWAVATGLPLHPAALDLYAQLGHDVPWL